MGARSGYRTYVLVVMVGINFLNYFDRYIGTAVGPAIQDEFHLNDSQIGFLASAFLLVYAIAALPFGAWADRGVRKNVIALGVGIWSLATFATGFARSYGQLIATRALVGIGEASYYPAGTSLLSDHFPRAARGRALAVWSGGTALGIAAGFVGGAQIAGRYGWRAAFFVAGVPGILFALLAYLLREPLRGSAEERGPQVRRSADLSRGAFLGLLRIPTLRACIAAETVLFIVLASTAYFLPIYVHRRFALSVAAAGTLAGGTIVVGLLAGSIVGGIVGDRLCRRSPRGHLQVSIFGFAAGAVFVAAALLAPTLTTFLPFFLLGAFCLYLYNGPFSAVKQNIVIPTLRASAVTISLLIEHLLGDSWAPYAVGALSDRLHSLSLALLLSGPPLLVAAAVLAAFALPTVAADTEAMEEAWGVRGGTGEPPPAGIQS